MLYVYHLCFGDVNRHAGGHEVLDDINVYAGGHPPCVHAEDLVHLDAHVRMARAGGRVHRDC